MTRRTEDEPTLIDARGLKCPWPVLRAARGMLDHGEIILLADDPVALIDIPALAQNNGYWITLSNEGNHQRFHLMRVQDDPPR